MFIIANYSSNCNSNNLLLSPSLTLEMDVIQNEAEFHTQLGLHATKDEVIALAYLLTEQNQIAMRHLKQKDDMIDQKIHERWTTVEKLAEQTKISDDLQNRVNQLEGLTDFQAREMEAVTAKLVEKDEKINKLLMRNGEYKAWAESTDEEASTLKIENERLNIELKDRHDGCVKLNVCLTKELDDNARLNTALKLVKKRESGVKAEGARLRKEVNALLTDKNKLSQQEVAQVIRDNCKDEKCNKNKKFIHKTLARLHHQVNRLEAVAYMFSNILKQYNIGSIDYSRVGDGMYALFTAPGEKPVALTFLSTTECGRNKDGTNDIQSAASTCGNNPTSQSVNPCQPTTSMLISKCEKLADRDGPRVYGAVTAVAQENGKYKAVKVKSNYERTRRQMDKRYGKVNNAHEVKINGNAADTVAYHV